MMTLCPLCLNRSSFTHLNGPNKRMFLCCDKCRLVFTTTNFAPTPDEEKKRNKLQKNGVNSGLINLLNQALEPVLPLLTKEMKGLDFSSGAEPILSGLLEQKGIQCSNFDPLFYPEMPEGPFDFIFVTKSFEHFFLPARELQTIKNLLNPGGILIVMAEKWKTPELISRWSYAKDQKRVAFYHAETFKYIAEKYKFNMIQNNASPVIIMQKEKIEVETETETETETVTEILVAE